MTKSAMKQTNTANANNDNGEMDSSKSRQRHHDRHIYFGDLEIREFPLIMGDNPYCQGAPLQLGWTPVKMDVVDLDFYEYTRDPRRSKKKFHMKDVEREIYLLSIGHSMNDIMEACDKGKKVRRDRYNSFHGKKWDRFRVVVESAKHRLTGGQTLSSNNQNVVSAMTA